MALHRRCKFHQGPLCVSTSSTLPVLDITGIGESRYYTDNNYNNKQLYQCEAALPNITEFQSSILIPIGFHDTLYGLNGLAIRTDTNYVGIIHPHPLRARRQRNSKLYGPIFPG